MFESFKENRTVVYKPDSLFILPYKFTQGRALVFNNRLHILGGKDFSDNESLKHYSWDGNTWKNESTLPYSFKCGAAVVYNGKIHIMGSDVDDHRQKHYAWNGNTWTSVATLPNTIYHGRAVEWNGKIHAVGFGSSHSINYGHYSFDGTTWEYVSNVSYTQQTSSHYYLDLLFQYGSLYIYDNKIYALSIGNGGIPTYWDGSGTWKNASTGYIYYNASGTATAVYNSYIYTMGGAGSSNAGSYNICKSIETTRIQNDDYALPYAISFTEAVVYKNKLYLVGGGDWTCKSMIDVTTLKTFF